MSRSTLLVILTALLVMSFVGVAFAGERSFATPDEAAMFALQKAVDATEYYEMGGAILRGPDGKYVASAPATDYSGDSSSKDEDPADYPAGYTLVAGYHTHPCLPLSHIPGMFSPQDLRTARTVGREEFMADLCTGNVHAWAPGVDLDPAAGKPLLVALDPDHALTPGRIVGHIKVTGKPLEH